MDAFGNTIQQCEVCGANDLTQVGNEIICPHCETTFATQQAISTEVDISTQFRYLSQIVEPKEFADTSRKSKKKAEPEPWKLSEAFQHLLLVQLQTIQTAFKLPSDYRKMAVKLWMHYLRVTGEAMLSEEERSHCRYPHGWGWIYDPTEGNELYRKMILGRKRRKKPINISGTGDYAKFKKRFENEEILRHEEFEDGGDPFSSSSSDESALEESPAKVERKYWRGWISADTNLSFLLEYNLAICYIPLLFIQLSEKAFTLSDLLNLLRQNVVPYRDARSSLPTWIQIRDSVIARYFIRRRAFPVRCTFEKIIRCCMKMLNINEIPRFPLLTHVKQCVTSLKLPEYFVELAKMIATQWLASVEERKPNQDNPSMFKGPISADSLATAFIVLVLFWIYGDTKNDVDVLQREHQVNKLRALSNRDNLFIYSEWLSLITHSNSAHKTIDDLQNIDSFFHLPHAGQLLNTEDRVIKFTEDDEDSNGLAFEYVNQREYDVKKKNRFIERKEFVEDLMSPFQDLVKSCMNETEEEEERRRNYQWDFSHHVVCYPRNSDDLWVELGFENDSHEESSGSINLFDDDDSEGTRRNSLKNEFKEIMKHLPNFQSIVKNMKASPPSKVPEDFVGTLSICSQVIYEDPKTIWKTVNTLHKALNCLRDGNGKINEKQLTFLSRHVVCGSLANRHFYVAS